jgi:hypothetical protein
MQQEAAHLLGHAVVDIRFRGKCAPLQIGSPYPAVKGPSETSPADRLRGELLIVVAGKPRQNFVALRHF